MANSTELPRRKLLTTSTGFGVNISSLPPSLTASLQNRSNGQYESEARILQHWEVLGSISTHPTSANRLVVQAPRDVDQDRIDPLIGPLQGASPNDIAEAMRALNLEIFVMHGDIRDEQRDFLLGCKEVAIDTETTGLSPFEHQLKLIQIYVPDGKAILVRSSGQQAPRLASLLESPNVLKIFHHARFDLGFLQRWLGVKAKNIFCTKIASKLLRESIPSSSLRELVKYFLGIEIPKTQQKSNWAGELLTREQLLYAVRDVLFLPSLKQTLELKLTAQGLRPLGEECFKIVPFLAELDGMGFNALFEY